VGRETREGVGRNERGYVGIDFVFVFAAFSVIAWVA
jgi:hypothetical protein